MLQRTDELYPLKGIALGLVVAPLIWGALLLWPMSAAAQQEPTLGGITFSVSSQTTMGNGDGHWRGRD